MPFEKGQSGNPAGKPKGSANATTRNAREAISAFVEGNVERLNGWLDAIAEKDPEKAYRCLMDVLEYHVPKLQRSELIGDKNNPIEHRIVTVADSDVIARYAAQQKPPEGTK